MSIPSIDINPHHFISLENRIFLFELNFEFIFEKFVLSFLTIFWQKSAGLIKSIRFQGNESHPFGQPMMTILKPQPQAPFLAD